MADKVDRKLEASFLQVTVETKKKAAPFTTVQLVCFWALLTAASIVGSFALACALDHYHVPKPSWMFPRAGTELTAAGAAEERATAIIRHGVVWCSVAEAAVAALALLLPARRHRSRQALAYIALAATATNHLMVLWAFTLFIAADPGDIFLLAVRAVDISVFVVIDTNCFLALGRGDYANVPC